MRRGRTRAVSEGDPRHEWGGVRLGEASWASVRRERTKRPTGA